MKHRVIQFALTTALAVTLMTGSHIALTSDYEHRWEDDEHAYDRARQAQALSSNRSRSPAAGYGRVFFIAGLNIDISPDTGQPFPLTSNC